MRKLLSLLVCVASALTLTATAAASNGGIGPVPPVSPNGVKANDAYWLIFALTSVIFVVVEGALIVFVIRFRSRGRARTEDGPDIHGSTKLETAWTIVPIVLLAVIATFVFVSLPGFTSPSKADAAGAVKVDIIAHQFYWEFHYPNGALSYDQLVAPAGKTVLLQIKSADVAHSWWIPAFGPKTDAIPGQTNHAWFKVSKLGTYTGQCSELCGILHAKMIQTVRIVPQAEYETWVASQSTLTPVDLGRLEFDASCAKCHGAKAQGFVGPTLIGQPATTDPVALTPILRNGIRTMPAIGNGWSDTQIAALVAYFKTNPFGGTSGK